jgi:hypothetical protein
LVELAVRDWLVLFLAPQSPTQAAAVDRPTTEEAGALEEAVEQPRPGLQTPEEAAVATEEQVALVLQSSDTQDRHSLQAAQSAPSLATPFIPLQVADRWLLRLRFPILLSPAGVVGVEAHTT